MTKKMAESVDCSEFCRLCLVKEHVNTPIFEEFGDIQSIHVKITSCLPIKVSKYSAILLC